VIVTSAGTEPDPAVAPAVAAHLKKNGYSVPISKPTRDFEKADAAIKEKVAALVEELIRQRAKPR